MLLPYYIASMNIEHAYMERTGEYKPFPGICLVDTFELAEPEQSKLTFMTEENTERVKRQKEAPIFVVLGNPPYNAAQVNENDNNRNRRYPALDRRISETYSSASRASTVNKSRDPFIRAFRWASDRIAEEGVVAFITNSSYLDQLASDGMRRYLADEFDEIYVVNLGGNVRQNPKISGTTHNVFGIQLGVAIAILIRKREHTVKPARIFYQAVDDNLRRDARLALLDQFGSAIRNDGWLELVLTSSNDWLRSQAAPEFGSYMSIANKETKSDKKSSAVFRLFSIGLNTNRDVWVYAADSGSLKYKILRLSSAYNAEVRRWFASDRTQHLDDFLTNDPAKLPWSSRLKECLLAHKTADYSEGNVRRALYRPFSQQLVYFDDILIHRRGRMPVIFPTAQTEAENIAICATGVAGEKPFMAMAASCLVDLHLVGPGCGTQVFPFYTYDEDGSNRRENITDWALNEFRTHYGDPNITKWDIFHYVYAVLHNPEYRERYAANLKRELPRIPFVGLEHSPKGDTIVAPDPSASSGLAVSPGSIGINDPESFQGRHKNAGPSARAEALSRDDNLENGSDNRGPSTPRSSAAADDLVARDDRNIFWAFVSAGKKLADLHVNYEQQPEHPLERVEKGQLNWRVEKMRFSKDKTTLVYNDFLTLRGIPPETYEYRLGNRSALEWVIDQYQVSTDKRSGIVNDPNRTDDPEYIVRLIGQVITVSLETMKIVKALPPLCV
jgi:predicted helicase